MAHYPRSGACLGIASSAGWMEMRPGVYRLPSDLAALRAGVAVDLDAVRRARLGGSKDAARARLAFLRDARLFLAPKFAGGVE